MRCRRHSNRETILSKIKNKIDNIYIIYEIEFILLTTTIIIAFIIALLCSLLIMIRRV